MSRTMESPVIAAIAWIALVAPTLGTAGASGASLPAPSGASSTINLKALFHDTYSSSYRSPFGAVAANSHVVLKLRTAAHGATSVTLVVTHQDQNHIPTGSSQQALKLTK